MSKPVEFSKFFKLLFEIRNGDQEQKNSLEGLIDEYRNHGDCDSPLLELGQTFCIIGIEQIFEYSNQGDLKNICDIDKEGWSNLKEEKGSSLPHHLANSMINYAKDNDLSSSLSSKWSVPKGQIQKHINGMARYITEGLIEVLE